MGINFDRGPKVGPVVYVRLIVFLLGWIYYLKEMGLSRLYLMSVFRIKERFWIKRHILLHHIKRSGLTERIGNQYHCW